MGPGAKDIGGEIQVDSLGYALFLKDRGYVVDPDPTKPEVQKAFEHGAIRTLHATAGSDILIFRLQTRLKNRL